MKNIRVTNIILALGITFMVSSVSGAASDAGIESLFSTGTGARSLGMGGGFTSLANDASALYYNPAGLPLLKQHELSFMHMELFEGSIYDFGAWTYPSLGLGGFGVGYMRVGTNDIVRSENFVEMGTFDYAYSQILIGYGRELEGGISTGLTLKIVNQRLDQLSDFGIGLDMGALIQISSHLSAGVILRDIIPATIKLQAVKENPPTSLAGGLALHDYAITSAMDISATVELEKIEKRDPHIHTGLEMVFGDIFAIRSGYDNDNLAIGTGFKVGRMKIDYAYKVMDYIQDSHRFSLSFLLGPSVAEQMERKKREAAIHGTRILEDERTRQLQLFTGKAAQFYDQFRLDSALTYYNRALAFDANNQEIIGTIAAIEEALEIQRQQSRQIEKTQAEMENLITSFYSQAVSFFDKGHYTAANDMLDLIFDVDKNNPEALSLNQRIKRARATEILDNLETGRKFESEGNYFDAIRAFSRVLELDPENAEVKQAMTRFQEKIDLAQQLNTAIELFRTNQYTKARRRFEAVLSLKPNDPVALEYLQKIEKLNVREDALEELQDDRVMWPIYLEGLRHMRNKEYQKAIDSWQRVLQKYPNNLNTLNNIEQARLRLQSEEDK